MEGGRWSFSPVLPPRYRSYDLYHAYRVPIRGPRPYLHHEIYRERYARARGYGAGPGYHGGYDPGYDHARNRGYGRGYRR
jgi:hypothetical protein